MLYNWIPRVFHIGPLSLTIYGLFIAAAIAVGLSVAGKVAKEKQVDPDLILELGTYAIIGGVLGARLLYVLLDLGTYLENPGSIIAIWQGGLSFHGAVIGGALAAAIYLRDKTVSFWTAADIFAPSLALSEAVGRIGCDVYGRAVVSSAPLALQIGGQAYHNVPLYTLVAQSAVFVLLWRVRDRHTGGQLFWRFVFLFSVIRFFLEFVRDSVMLGPLSVAQVASIGFIILASFFIFGDRRRTTPQ